MAPGSLSLLVVFVFFLFSALGLGIIFVSDIHLKFGRHRRDISLLAIAAENGVKSGYALLADAVILSDGPRTCANTPYEALREDCQTGGTKALVDAIGLSFPLDITGTENPLTWNSKVDFASVAPDMQNDYFIAEYGGAVLSEGRLVSGSPAKHASLDVSATVMAGFLPLARFPLLIAADLDPVGKQAILDNSDVAFLSSRRNFVYPRMSFSSESTISRDAGAFLKKAFNVKVLSPEKLTRTEIRSALGLEMVNEPVPEGVYLIENDLGLGGLFVQGNIDEMILAIDAGFQVISVRRGNDRWLLKFCPAQNITSFTSPTGTRNYARIPLGMILINGRIGSFGGGIVDRSGSVELASDETAPSVLNGVGLTIVCADEVALASHLIQEGVEWVDGIPYLKKDAASQLVIYANGQDLVENSVKSGKISVRPEASSNLMIQAALTAKSAFVIGGSRKTMTLAGGLQAGGLSTNGNTLKILPDERMLTTETGPAYSPTSAVPLLAVLSLHPIQWNDY